MYTFESEKIFLSMYIIFLCVENIIPLYSYKTYITSILSVTTSENNLGSSLIFASAMKSCSLLENIVCLADCLGVIGAIGVGPLDVAVSGRTGSDN